MIDHTIAASSGSSNSAAMTEMWLFRGDRAFAFWTHPTGLVVMNLRGVTIARRGLVWSRVWLPVRGGARS